MKYWIVLSFSKIGESLISKLTKSDGSPPPDDTLERCKEELKVLSNQIITVRKQFDVYTEHLTQTTEACVSLSGSVSKFYEESAHSGTKQWVKFSDFLFYFFWIFILF